MKRAIDSRGRSLWLSFMLCTQVVGAMGWQSAALGADVTVKRVGAIDVRPGPDILYSAAHSPQFDNAGPWKAKPILVSGTSAYRDGEFLYQDYLYDDQGAGGTATYPDEPKKYAGNAADFVEVRVKPLRDATAVRLTFNSMLDPQLVGTTIAFGGDKSKPVEWPHDANTSAPGRVFVTVHGTTGDIVGVDGKALSGEPSVEVNVKRRQVDVRVPYSAFDPRGKTVRVAAATGLWDQKSDAYLPLPESDSSSVFLNVAFRYAEGVARSPLEGAGAFTAPLNSWSNEQQSQALSEGDISAFFATVDFTKLMEGVDDELLGRRGGAPRWGYLARIMVRNVETMQGRRPGPEENPCFEPCNAVPNLPGRLQPYLLYVPRQAPPAGGYSLVLNVHFCTGNYRNKLNDHGGPNDTSVLSETTGSLVVWPNSAGCLWWWGQYGAEAFEALGDVLRRYPIDRDRMAITGTSGGGYGTWKLSAQWPDLFGRAAAEVPCPSAETNWAGPPAPPVSGEAASIIHMVASWRHVPMYVQMGAYDTICSANADDQILAKIDQLGYRYEWRQYPTTHSSFGWQDMGNFLRGARVDPNPPHVTYVYNLKASETKWGLNADHAYWLSGLELRDESGDAPMGTIDVFSHGFGIGDPSPQLAQPIAGMGQVLVQAPVSLVPWEGLKRQWDPALKTPVKDVLDITAMNIREVTIDVRRARVSCDPKLNVDSDGPITIRLAGCDGKVRSR